MSKHIIGAIAALVLSASTPVLAQDARRSVPEDFYALAPSAQGQSVEQRRFDDSQMAPAPSSPASDSSQRVRGGRW